MIEPKTIRYANPSNDFTEMFAQCVAWNSPVSTDARSNIAAPQISGTAVRPSASSGNFNFGEITTPTAHDTDPTSTASNPSELDPCMLISTPVSKATPITPRLKPSRLSRLLLCWPMASPSTKINIGSVAMSSAARPDPTYCSAQCSVP